MSNNNSGWEVKEGKIKIGTEWKDAKQLKRSFIIELLVAIGFGILCVYAFTIHVVFGVIMIFATLFFVLTAMGSVNALKALNEKIKLLPEVNFGGAKDKMNKLRDKLGSKVVEDITQMEVVLTIPLTKTANKKRQETISALERGSVLNIHDDYMVKTQEDKEVGEISKANINKLNTYKDQTEDCNGFKCRVDTIEKNDNDKHVVIVEILKVN
ncbi:MULTISPECIES: hypothetical protein [unclassified Breznakia]|uniref:hypothetical protein n=1 Tax=unclassified Breznakia TaxID=2623764 RepID=UPI002407610C|nr:MULTISPECIES: hypothetical protein [unclassified Breznakia]MDF9837669.1 hypothetical protein [Breznakia sp. PFB2-8]MDF9859533.1 hypothetical protein [Breznakia sp. PH5-24]